MSHSRQTEHYELPLYDGGDIINPLTDFNNANETIDEAVYDANQRSVGAETTAQEAKDIAQGYDARVTQAVQTANDAMTLANHTQDMIADDFDPMKEGGYKVGDFVIYNGVLYRFINAHTGAWDASDVQASPVLIEAIGEVVDEGKQAIDDAVADAEEEIAGQTEKVTKTQAMIAQPFDENKTDGYKVDDIVTYADKLYKFTSAHSGAWTGLDVEQVDAVELIPFTHNIRINIDTTTTYGMLGNQIADALISAGITDFRNIKNCVLDITLHSAVGSSDDEYRYVYETGNSYLIHLNRNSTGIATDSITLDFVRFGIYRPNRSYADTGYIQLGQNGVMNFTGKRVLTNETIIESSVYWTDGYADFIW